MALALARLDSFGPNTPSVRCEAMTRRAKNSHDRAHKRRSRQRLSRAPSRLIVVILPIGLVLLGWVLHARILLALGAVAAIIIIVAVVRRIIEATRPTSIQDYTALLGAAIALITLALQFWTTFGENWTGGRSSTTAADTSIGPRPRLVVSKFTVGRVGEVPADVWDYGEEKIVDRIKDLFSPIIDVTLNNTGTATAVITRAELRMKQAAELESCLPEGGPIAYRGAYTFTVPRPLPKTPFVLKKDISYALKPNEPERIAFEVGPREIPESPVVWIYNFDLVLYTDASSEPLQAGTASLVQPVLSQGHYVEPPGRPVPANAWHVMPELSMNSCGCRPLPPRPP
jgi:hypothetical protein